MQVIVTQNRDKTNGLVNGQKATVVNIQGRTIFLRLPNSMIVQTYTVPVYKKGELHTSHLTLCASLCSNNLQSPRTNFEGHHRLA